MPSESEIISRVRRLARVSNEVVVGIGDDAAVIKTTSEKDLIACCDLMIEGVHFRLEWAAPGLLGHKALAVTLSDVAAMGGVPKFALVSIAAPRHCSAQFIDDLFRGILDLADASEVSIIGGDTSGSRDSLFIDVSVIGEVESGKAVLRRGAKPGDLIFVSGSLGASALGLSLLESGFRLDESNQVDDARQQAAMRHLAPQPQIKLGRAIGYAGLATAMIDISDGLSTDLWHILDESDCGAIIHAGAIPLAECVRSIASEASGIDPLTLALNGGEEYELLFTALPGKANALAELSDALAVRLTAIGETVTGTGLRLERDGAMEWVGPSGYEHSI